VSSRGNQTSGWDKIGVSSIRSSLPTSVTQMHTWTSLYSNLAFLNGATDGVCVLPGHPEHPAQRQCPKGQVWFYPFNSHTEEKFCAHQGTAGPLQAAGLGTTTRLKAQPSLSQLGTNISPFVPWVPYPPSPPFLTRRGNAAK
jgi:hypothetical protein